MADDPQRKRLRPMAVSSTVTIIETFNTEQTGNLYDDETVTGTPTITVSYAEVTSGTATVNASAVTYGSKTYAIGTVISFTLTASTSATVQDTDPTVTVVFDTSQGNKREMQYTLPLQNYLI